MTRLHHTAAALMVFAICASGCATNRALPTSAASMTTTIGVNSFLWRAAVDTVSFAPLIQANATTGIIITDWYSNPKAPNERVKLTVAILDRDLRADGFGYRPRASSEQRHLGRCAGGRGDGAEARRHHPHPGPRYSPHHRPGIRRPR